MTFEIFRDNPRRSRIDLSDRQLELLFDECASRFVELPGHHRGESCELRRTPVPGILVQRLLPSLNSISSQRKGSLEGSQQLRQGISRVFWRALHRRGLPTCHLACNQTHTLVCEEELPPVEVVVKAALVGTPTRLYWGLLERTDRFGERFVPEQQHAPYVRFDYRNPLQAPGGERLRDECLPPAFADRLIDTLRAERSALAAFEVISEVLQRCDLVVLDACFLFDVSGQVLCYEVSPDNMRVKCARARASSHATEFDKDLWRRGAAPSMVLEQWQTLYDRLRQVQD